jgi:selenocysteine lyase/cysteine desulfurase
MERCGIDYLAFSAHKVYAPFGSGALVARRGLLTFSPACRQRIIESGEENVGGIAGLGKALVLLQRIGMGVIAESEEALTAHTLRGLARIPGLQLYGVQDPDSPSFAHKGAVIAFGLKGVPHNLAAQELAEHGGIGVRNGCFCAHLLVKHLLRIPSLRARVADLGVILFPELTSAVLPGLVRVSLGLENSTAEIDTLVRVLDRIALQPRSQTNRLVAALHNGTLLPPTEVRQQMEAFARAAAQRVYSRPQPEPAPGHALMQNRNGG